ncbi:MAG: hypothetical protein AAF371_15640 [Pseudomonadota bacterium]
MLRAVPLLLLLAAACAAPVRPAGEGVVDGAYERGGALFSTGTSLEFAVAAGQEAGKLRLCGAWVANSVTGQTALYLDRAVASGQVQVAGQTVLRNPGRFVRRPDNTPLEGGRARCFVSEIPWQPAFADAAPQLRFVRQTFDADTEGLSGGEIVFRQVSADFDFPF